MASDKTQVRWMQRIIEIFGIPTYDRVTHLPELQGEVRYAITPEKLVRDFSVDELIQLLQRSDVVYANITGEIEALLAALAEFDPRGNTTGGTLSMDDYAKCLHRFVGNARNILTRFGVNRDNPDLAQKKKVFVLSFPDPKWDSAECYVGTSPALLIAQQLKLGRRFEAALHEVDARIVQLLHLRLNELPSKGKEEAAEVDAKGELLVKDLDLPIRISNALKVAGVTTVSQLLALRKDQTGRWRIRNFGVVSILEVRERLIVRGHLSIEEEWPRSSGESQGSEAVMNDSPETPGVFPGQSPWDDDGDLGFDNDNFSVDDDD
ncbi:MAG: DNA-directed RNA polymerase subunit alpha C-terminal domain-containing protein [Candidatus Levybacteria bacterium]|nr:DNA-directed RNA polymerase subunit alpha C-terminal domain-containing protein [Candidatus Levybacteria bacterium]